MNARQQAQARQQAAEMIDAGADPQGLVHILFFPRDCSWAYEVIQGISTPLPAGSDLSSRISRYYTLAELAEFAEMTQFDVLAVIGDEAETLHVEVAGAVPNGTRTDAITGHPVEIIGHVWAVDTATARAIAWRRVHRQLTLALLRARTR